MLEYLFNPKTGKTEVYAVTSMTEKKPILYLYPEEEMDVQITFENAELLTTTYPKYNSGWNVKVQPNGDIYDGNNQYFYGLYWEEKYTKNIDFKEGFYVTKENAIRFLEEKLNIIGLNRKEANEFITYWLPVLEKNGKSIVYFELTDERQAYNRIIINPQPDSLLRVNMHIKKVDQKMPIKEQRLPSFERKGFVAVEWGGVVH